MSMVVCMVWVHRVWVRKNPSFIYALVSIALITGFLAVVKVSESSVSSAKVVTHIDLGSSSRSSLSCFDTATVTIERTTDINCPGGLVSLGRSALVQITDSASVTTEVHPTLLNRFNAAYLAAKQEGVYLYITSGFRSLARQEVLFERAVDKYGNETEAAKWVLPAPYSHHPQGLALDVNYPGDPIGAEWLELNGSKFGLCRVYANEWWHFEGVIAPGEICPPLAPNALVDLR
jgi:D-alanyl-D-alanine dipeptidase